MRGGILWLYERRVYGRSLSGVIKIYERKSYQDG